MLARAYRSRRRSLTARRTTRAKRASGGKRKTRSACGECRSVCAAFRLGPSVPAAGLASPDSTQRLAAAVIMLTGGSKIAQPTRTLRPTPGSTRSLPSSVRRPERRGHARTEAAGAHQREFLVRLVVGADVERTLYVMTRQRPEPLHRSADSIRSPGADESRVAPGTARASADGRSNARVRRAVRKAKANVQRRSSANRRSKRALN